MSASPDHFADRLIAAVKSKRTPLVVGLDPRFEMLPETLRGFGAMPSLADRAAAYETFCREIIDVVADRVPAVKPQSAFFEQLGPAGVTALANVAKYAREKKLVVVMDAKRGDIGSTAAAYASAYLDRSESGPWQCDSLTVNPYLGDDSLTPFVDVANQHGSGIFVLVRTSNPGSQTFQQRDVAGGENNKLFQLVADHVQSLAKSSVGVSGYGAVGAVVGATEPGQLAMLRRRMPNTLFLIPGFGAQGGSAADIAGGLDDFGLGGLVNSSRGIIFAYQRDQYSSARTWTEAVSAATDDAIEAIASETPAGKLR